MLHRIKESLALDLEKVQEGMLLELDVDLDYVREVREVYRVSQGKKMRPIMLLLSARGISGLDSTQQNGVVVDMSVAVEMIHAATLLHDDVIDEAHTRRGKPSGNYMLGNSGSILVGDFLYSRAFQVMLRHGKLDAIRLLSDTTNRIATGELLQLMNRGRIDLTPQEYFHTIDRKTACLFSSCARLGAILAGANTEVQEQMASFGHEFGMVFQIIDDHLDYTADSQSLGKPAGHDLKEGRATLPVIWAIMHSKDSDKEMLKSAIDHSESVDLSEIRKIVIEAGGLDYAMDCAKLRTQKAIEYLSALPKGPWKEKLIELSEFALRRDS